MNLAPYEDTPRCPKCLALIRSVTWHADQTFPPASMYVHHDSHTERVPPGLPEHLSWECGCGYRVLMETAGRMA